MQDIFSDQIKKQGKKMRQYNKSHLITIGSLFEPLRVYKIFDCIVKKIDELIELLQNCNETAKNSSTCKKSFNF